MLLWEKTILGREKKVPAAEACLVSSKSHKRSDVARAGEEHRSLERLDK